MASGSYAYLDHFTSTVHHDTYRYIAQSHHRGKTVLITGASKGIGRQTALAFARAGAGTLILAARSSLDSLLEDVQSVSAETKIPTKAIALSLDVSSEEQMDAAVQQVREHVSAIDILVNNAGRLEEAKAVGDTDRQDWWRTWEVNLKGTYLAVHAFLPMVLQSTTRTIINIASRGGLYTRFGASAYGGSKAAMIRLTEALSFEYKEQGLVAIAVHPGNILTEMGLGMPKHTHSMLVDSLALAADTVTWLTAERREWLGGRFVSVNWDMEELVSRREEIVGGEKLKLRLSM